MHPGPPSADITPVVIPADAPGVVLFGGSFDPPHRWHAQIAKAAQDHLFRGEGWTVFTPAARSPLKQAGPVAADADRIAMLLLLADSLTRSAVWTDEIDRGRAGDGPSFTIDTVERFRRKHPLTPLRLLIGSDQAASFHLWRRFRDLLRQAEPIIALRPPHLTAGSMRAAMASTGVWTGQELDEWARRILPAEVSDVSSTQIREALAAGQDADRWLTPAVADYIRTKRLYTR